MALSGWTVGALLLGGLLVAWWVSGRVEPRLHAWLLQVGQDHAPRTALVVLGLHLAAGAVLALAGLTAYEVTAPVVGGALLYVVVLPLLSVEMVFSPTSWHAPNVAEETRALRARGASRATATTVFWLGFLGLVAILAASAGMLLDLWLY